MASWNGLAKNGGEMNIAIITIGNRDIILKKDEELPSYAKDCRSKGKYILENFSKLKDKLEFPIIQPFLDYITDRSIEIDKFILIATDQPEEEDEKYRKRDTVFYANIVKTYLERFNNKVFVLTLQENINDFIHNYKYFQESLEKYQKVNIEKIFLLPVGGIPNINTPLIMASILIFKDKVNQFYVDEKHHNCLPVPFSKKLLKEIENERIKTALESYFFASIKEISSNKFIKMIADYAYNRTNFNLVQAKIIADDMIMEFPNENLVFMSESITELRNSFQEKIKEIFFTALIKIKQNQFIDALLRLYSFTDNLLLQRVCELYNLKYNSNKNFQKWWNEMAKKITENNPNIEDDLDQINNSKANLKKPSVLLYNKLIKIKRGNDKIFQLTEPLIALSNLRNKSIAAHGFEGVSLKQIDDVLATYKLNLNSLVENIETFFNVSFEDSDYNKIVNLIISNLRQNY
jgi:hypothetical protein